MFMNNIKKWTASSLLLYMHTTFSSMDWVRDCLLCYRIFIYKQNSVRSEPSSTFLASVLHRSKKVMLKVVAVAFWHVFSRDGSDSSVMFTVE